MHRAVLPAPASSKAKPRDLYGLVQFAELLVVWFARSWLLHNADLALWVSHVSIVLVVREAVFQSLQAFLSLIVQLNALRYRVRRCLMLLSYCPDNLYTF